MITLQRIYGTNKKNDNIYTYYLSMCFVESCFIGVLNAKTVHIYLLKKNKWVIIKRVEILNQKALIISSIFTRYPTIAALRKIKPNFITAWINRYIHKFLTQFIYYFSLFPVHFSLTISLSQIFKSIDALTCLHIIICAHVMWRLSDRKEKSVRRLRIEFDFVAFTFTQILLAKIWTYLFSSIYG